MNGLIGFFDILGYQNFLENNSAEDSARDVLKIITDMPEVVKKYAMNLKGRTKEEDKELNDALNHLVFSDTILFTLPYPENADAAWKTRARIFFLACSAILTSDMFRMGLPLRGVVHEGNFLIEKMCFAGSGIVEAYRLCESLPNLGVRSTFIPFCLIMGKIWLDSSLLQQNDGVSSNIPTSTWHGAQVLGKKWGQTLYKCNILIVLNKFIFCCAPSMSNSLYFAVS